MLVHAQHKLYSLSSTGSTRCVQALAYVAVSTALLSCAVTTRSCLSFVVIPTCPCRVCTSTNHYGTTFICACAILCHVILVCYISMLYYYVLLLSSCYIMQPDPCIWDQCHLKATTKKPSPIPLPTIHHVPPMRLHTHPFSPHSCLCHYLSLPTTR